MKKIYGVKKYILKMKNVGKTTKVLYKTVSLMLIFIMSFSFASCTPSPVISGDFEYHVLGGYAYISNLSEEGQSKPVVVVPESLNGYTVFKMGVPHVFPYGKLQNKKWQSSELKKLYLQTFADSPKEIYTECKNEIEVFYLKDIGYHGLRGIWRQSKCENIKGIYVQKEVYNDIIKEFVEYQEYLLEEYIIDKIGDFNEEIKKETKIDVKCANVTYYYNYMSAQPFGYYWIDNVAEGEKIQYVPNIPKRTMYTFCGWFTEPECVNEWDFEVDTVPKGGVDLYAKWQLWR